MPIIMEQSNVRQISRYEAIKSVLRQLDQHDYADVALDIQIRIDGDVRTITVQRS